MLTLGEGRVETSGDLVHELSTKAKQSIYTLTDGQELWVKNKVVDAAEMSNSGWSLLYSSGAQWRASSMSDIASRGASGICLRCWRDYISRLTWECLSVPPEKLEEVAMRGRCLGCSYSPALDKWKMMLLPVLVKLFVCAAFTAWHQHEATHSTVGGDSISMRTGRWHHQWRLLWAQPAVISSRPTST